MYFDANLWSSFSAKCIMKNLYPQYFVHLPNELDVAVIEKCNAIVVVPHRPLNTVLYVQCIHFDFCYSGTSLRQLPVGQF